MLMRQKTFLQAVFIYGALIILPLHPVQQAITPQTTLFIMGQLYLSGLVTEQLKTILQNETAGGPDHPIGTLLRNHVYPRLSLLAWSTILYLNYKASKKGGTTTSSNDQNEPISKGHPRLITADAITENFSSVAGCQEAKTELQDIVDFLKFPKRYAALGARISKGVLLTGMPGNGKTLLARAMAKEAGCTFLYINASEFIQVYSGVGAARVRDLFEFARVNTPCIIFIDELDTIGMNRNLRHGAHAEHDQTLNQLLAEMDGFDTRHPIIVIGATNRLSVLDPALLRSGRFDQIISIPTPDTEARIETLKIHTRNKKVDPRVNFKLIAQRTAGFAAADIASLVNQAAFLAAKRHGKNITTADFDMARDKVAATVMRRMKAEGISFDPLTKNPADVIAPSSIDITFNDIAGCQDAKESLQDVLAYLKNPEQFNRLGARLSKGVLLTGSPGNGKTMLAKALAKEAHCMFLSVSGSSFVETYVGVGAARVRALFEQARQYAPCIIFIDEIDSIGRRESSTTNNEASTTINQLLVELDGFAANSKLPIIVIGATNNPNLLDPALVRSGRFDQKIIVPQPTVAVRHQILQLATRTMPLDTTVNLAIIARATIGFSAADISNMVNQAAILATKRNAQAIGIQDFEEARDILLMGRELKGIEQTAEEQRVTAIHESGHALVSLLNPTLLAPLHKVTIVPRGHALGVTFSLPQEKYSHTKQEMIARVMMALGGRIAEEIVIGQLSTGASNDFETAYDLAREMVCSYGMSSAIGTIVYNKQKHTFSTLTSELIDTESKKIIDEAYAATKELLTAHRQMLEILADKLLECKTLTAQEVHTLLAIPLRTDTSFSAAS
ncbi:AAA family ATPase [Candidatus Dependentiae bacterium]|nr:AAA family ATPase [Candidatus Dependentiae bacterium]